MSNAYRSSKGAQAVLPTGDAVEANVLAGKTFSNAQGTGKTGTMVNRGAVSQTIAPGGSYTIPEGYHNGSGIVSASSFSISKYVLFASWYNTANAIFNYDNGAGAQTHSGNIETPYTASDILNAVYNSNATFTITFKVDCYVYFVDGDGNHFEGQKMANTTLNFSTSKVGSVFAYTT